MLLSFGNSMLLMSSNWHRLMLAMVGLILLFFLWRVPVREIAANAPDTFSN